MWNGAIIGVLGFNWCESFVFSLLLLLNILLDGYWKNKCFFTQLNWKTVRFNIRIDLLCLCLVFLLLRLVYVIMAFGYFRGVFWFYLFYLQLIVTSPPKLFNLAMCTFFLSRGVLLIWFCETCKIIQTLGFKSCIFYRTLKIWTPSSSPCRSVFSGFELDNFVRYVAGIFMPILFIWHKNGFSSSPLQE